MNEEYREVNGYKGLFISNFGNYNTNNDLRIFKYDAKCQYEQIKYKGNNLQTHILVAITFPEICGEWHYGYEVHHKDGDHHNNRADNLLCLTQQQHHQLHINDKKGACKKIVCLLNNKVIKEYDSIKDFLKETGLSRWEVDGKFKNGYYYNGYIYKLK